MPERTETQQETPTRKKRRIHELPSTGAAMFLLYLLGLAMLIASKA